MAPILLNDVRKTYSGGVEAVKGVSLDIADGEFVVLVGPSGCGKSTLLRMVAGLESITSGEVSIGGRRVNDLEPAERDIAMVFQNYALYPHMSVVENLSYGLRNRRVPKPEIGKRVGEAAAILGLSGMLSRKPSQLSGGQRQRVAMGRAIVREPAAFLFDEPLSNLDAKLRVQMRGEVKSLQRRLRTTSLYVTHDQLEAMTLADRLVVLNGGRIEQVGTPIELYERPETSFVATFIGSPAMNLLPLDARTRESFVALPEGAWNEASLLGVRPEHMTISGEGATTPGVVAIRLRVESVELVGAESYVHGRLAAPGETGDAPLPVTGGGPLIAVRVPGHAAFEPGERIVAAAAPQALHRFDAAGGGRLPVS